MRIQKAREVRPPSYPTLADIARHPEHLRALPRGAAGPSRLATLIGLGLALRSLAAEDGRGGDERTPAAAAAPEKPRPSAEPRHGARKNEPAAARVALMLAEALEQDGRGAFGCVAINPPTFMAEDEALDLIEQELKAAGLRLVAHPELPGQGPARARTKPAREPGRWRGDDESLEAPPWEVLRHQFDFADPERGIYVVFLSEDDYHRWGGPGMSTAQYFDFPKLARAYAEELGTSRPDRPAVFGIFFDPLAHPDRTGPDLAGLTPAQRRLAEAGWNREQRRTREALDSQGRDKLRRQIAHFVDHLRREGLVGPAP